MPLKNPSPKPNNPAPKPAVRAAASAGTRADATKDISAKIQPVSSRTDGVNIVLYGRSGSGKTTLSATFPTPILLLDVKDKGTDSVSDVKGLDVLQVDDWVEFEQAYWFLAKDTKYKTVVVDTVSQLQELAIRQVMSEKKKDDKPVGGWGTLTKQEWGEVATMLKTQLLNIRDLKINVVFIAQERVFNVGDEGDDSGMLTPEVGARVMPSVASAINAAVDLIGNTFVREDIKKVKTADNKIVEKKTIQYCLRIGPNSVYTTKIRKPRTRDVPDFIVDPSYDKLTQLTKGK